MAKAERARERLIICKTEIRPGQRTTIDLPISGFYSHTPETIPVHVVRGRKDGPRLFVSATIHGDELNGVEIVRRLMAHKSLKSLRGTLIAIPVVNVHGFIHQSRYLPDRRDLNRNFPGSRKGSLTARLAYLFMQEIVSQCTHGIDLHTGAIHRANIPHVRGNLDDGQTLAMAQAFATPLLLNATMRDGSLRQAAAELGIPTLLYEAGEALRFDEVSILAGVRGIIRVMRHLEMLPPSRHRSALRMKSVVARSSFWMRASTSGIIRPRVKLGAKVTKDDIVATIADPFSAEEVPVSVPSDGIVIGRLNLPLINEGDALFHIASFGMPEAVEQRVEEFQEYFQPTVE